MLRHFVKKKIDEDARAPLRISLSVLREIRKSVGSLPAEHGGALGGDPASGAVTEFFFDDSARRSTVTYSPDFELLNRLFAEVWNPKGIRLMGFVHSHPGLREPSGGDLGYCRRILEHIPDLERLLVPIVISAADEEEFQFLPFAVEKEGETMRTVSLPMVVLDGDGETVTNWEAALVADEERPETTRETTDTTPPSTRTTTPRTPPRFIPSQTFSRVVAAYDLDRLMKVRVVYIGTGGAAGFIEDMARAGVGQHVMIDFDEVTETNLATQQTYRRDLGRPKVEAIAERIRDINPAALVVPVRRSLDDIDDREFEFLARGQTDHLPVAQTLICGLTDNFHAQARVNRLALHFGIPSLSAQVYLEGRAAEITFTHPDVTPACHRCILSSRYQAYIDGGYKNAVTSDGTPIFSTTRLNALKGFVAMALLHHGTSHPRWGSLLGKIGKRNLIQIRMDPDLSETLQLRIFDRVFEKADTSRILFDEAVWLPQEAEGPASGHPPCPDCRGAGNLRDSVGTYEDTTIMRT